MSRRMRREAEAIGCTVWCHPKTANQMGHGVGYGWFRAAKDVQVAVWQAQSSSKPPLQGCKLMAGNQACHPWKHHGLGWSWDCETCQEKEAATNAAVVSA
jgi:hypothetical protein